jgi:cytochrome oxidase Cu insertion factor (SCO1/SenC/PrrC family)
VSRFARGSLGAAILIAAACQPAARDEPPRYGRLPEFSLQDQLGRPVTRAGLAGRIWVADFIFTHCAGACPAMTARMARLRREVPDEVAFLSFTVDPANDTPEVLTRYAANFNAGPRWRFVTGPPKELYALSTNGFKLAAMEVPPEEQKAGGDGPFLHSSKFVLVDGLGDVRGYYDSTDEDDMKNLAADVARIQSGPGS